MSELFQLPESHPPALERARKAYAEAKDALDKAEEIEDEFGDPVPSELRRNLREAARRLQLEENLAANPQA